MPNDTNNNTGQIDKSHSSGSIRVSELTLCTKETLDKLYAFNIDKPQSNSNTGGFSILIAGWVVGRTSKAVKIEVISESFVLIEIPVNIVRPDVIAKNLTCNSNDANGFKAQVSLSKMPILLNLKLFVSLADGSRVYLGNIEIINSYTYRKYYFVNHQYRFIYASIPKNACTLFKRFALEYSDDKGFKDVKDIHAYLNKDNSDITLKDLSVFHDEQYFKFAILRNPFNRLVSAYLDKIIKWAPNQENFAKETIQKIYESRSLEVNYHKAVTFSQFINYLVNTPNFLLDFHWRPQYLFMENIDFDYVGRFEELDKTITFLEKKFGVKITTKVSNHRTKYGEIKRSKQANYHNMYSDELKKLNFMPDPNIFYTPELRSLVRTRYEKDIQNYKKYFGICL